MPELDESFLELPLSDVADAALGRARQLGCEHAEVRVERIRTQYVALRDSALETSLDDTEIGIGVRVFHRGSVGFAATASVSVSEALRLAGEAVDLAKAVAPALEEPVLLSAEPVWTDAVWVAPYEIDPITVPLVDKVDLLRSWTARLTLSPGVDHATGSVTAVCEDKFYADMAGTSTRQRRVRVHPVVEAVSLGGPGGFDTMRTLAPPMARGWEGLLGAGCDLDGEITALPELLRERLAAPSVEPGRYDLVVDPTNLWLTIHESVGHATELDRALGYEAAYAGTSFARPEMVGELRYGSELMNVVGDRIRPYGLATVGFDDEGVAAQSFDIVRNGVLVGFQVDRRIAAAAGRERSNGCAFADSPLHAPLQRMANVSLLAAPDGPSTEELIEGCGDGIYVVGDKSWSIDMQRHNFQFTGQRFYAIRSGRLAGQLRDVAYQATTTDFWGSMDGVGGEGTVVLGGAFNCGKGQPGQVAPVGHACPSARFHNVNVLNVRQESGR